MDIFEKTTVLSEEEFEKFCVYYNSSDAVRAVLKPYFQNPKPVIKIYNYSTKPYVLV